MGRRALLELHHFYVQPLPIARLLSVRVFPCLVLDPGVSPLKVQAEALLSELLIVCDVGLLDRVDDDFLERWQYIELENICGLSIVELGPAFSNDLLLEHFIERDRIEPERVW